jgi:NAD(P)-dependent dehydrogenase (short-subunit alcohol dehydrogenase family)
MDLRLNGKSAIVTGRSARIGFAIARTLAAEGVEVTIPGRSGRKLKEAIAPVKGAVRGIEVDLGTTEGAQALIEQVPQTDILAAAERRALLSYGRVGECASVRDVTTLGVSRLSARTALSRAGTSDTRAP